MSRKTRKNIFYALLALFFITGGAVVLYAQGWRFDFTAWRVEKVGAIYVRSFPQTANIFLNGKPIVNQAGFLSQGTFLTELFPRTYALALKAPGYADWHENAPVLPSLVTEFKYAVLVPLAPRTVATTSVKNIFTASGEIVVQTETNAIMWRGKTIGRGTIVGGSANFENIIFKNAAGDYLLYDFDDATSTDLSRFFPNGVSNPAIDPYDATKIVAGGNGRIFIFNTAAATTTVAYRVPGGNALGASLALSPSRIAWTRFAGASNDSSVVLYDKFAKATAVSSSTVAGQTIALAWINDVLLAVLQQDGGLFLYDVNSQTFQPLASDVKQIAVANDGSAIAALENQSLEIFPVTNAQTYHRFNIPDVAEARSVVWYKDADHLFVSYPDSVSFLDLDDLGLRNFVSVAKGTAPLYKPEENALYLINSAQEPVEFDFPS